MTVAPRQFTKAPDLATWRAWSRRHGPRRVHRPFPESVIQQLNYADWHGVPEVR